MIVGFWYFAVFSVVAFFCGYFAGRIDQIRSTRIARSSPFTDDGYWSRKVEEDSDG